MSKDPTNGELAVMMKNLIETMRDFKVFSEKKHDETHEKQDYTNGQVQGHNNNWIKYEEPIKQLIADRESKYKRYESWAWKVVGVTLASLYGFDKLDAFTKLLG